MAIDFRLAYNNTFFGRQLVLHKPAITTDVHDEPRGWKEDKVEPLWDVLYLNDENFYFNDGLKAVLKIEMGSH